MDITEVAALQQIIAASCILLDYGMECRQKKRRVWVKQWRERLQHSCYYDKLYNELKVSDPYMFMRQLRLYPEAFEHLLELVLPTLTKKETNMRKPICPRKKLMVTLRHLATGESMASLSMQYLVGHSTVSAMIPDVCKSIYDALAPTFMKTPSTEVEWKIIAHAYNEKWNFPHCIGSLDGKHVMITPPPGAGSLYYNYKGFNSIVLMAAVDADLRFIYADVGTNGRMSDRGIWSRCDLKHALDNNLLNFPQADLIPLYDVNLPYVFIGDEAFPLTTKTIRPYSKENLAMRDDRRIYNYRLSRARRCVENAFGVLANRFQIYRSPIRTSPEKVTTIVLCTLVLHNWLRTQAISQTKYAPTELLDREDEMTGTLIPGQWRRDPQAQGLMPVGHVAGNRIAADAQEVRENYCQYFNGVGAVPWQDKMIRPQ